METSIRYVNGYLKIQLLIIFDIFEILFSKIKIVLDVVSRALNIRKRQLCFQYF